MFVFRNTLLYVCRMKPKDIICSIRMDRKLHKVVKDAAKLDSRTFASMVTKVLKEKFEIK